MPGFFQHGGVSISTFIGWINEVCYIPGEWALYPCQFDNNRAAGGAALDSGSGDELQPGRYVIRTLPPGVFSMLSYYRLLTQRIRRGSDYGIPDHGRTSHESVLCQLYLYSARPFGSGLPTHIKSLTSRVGNKFRDASQSSRPALLHYRRISCG
jgi:hypothetical protein